MTWVFLCIQLATCAKIIANTEIGTRDMSNLEINREMIEKLLAERQETLALFCRIAGLQPYSQNDTQDIADTLQRFCELLVDYSAFGHFEIYERIVNCDTCRPKVVEMARNVYPRIVEASEYAVAFNDKYDANDHSLNLQDLAKDLNKLGEELAQRAEMEDRLIAEIMA